jgi:hypothetical protein
MLNLNSTGVVNIKVSDLAGRMVNEFRYTTTTTGPVEIPIETVNLKPGIYMVNFNSFTGETGSLKLLIKHHD